MLIAHSSFKSCTKHTLTRQHVIVRTFSLKEQIKFYWNGTKLLWANWKLSNELREKQKEGKELTRSEFLLVEKAKHDLKVAVPFLILFFTPIIGYFVPFIVAIFPSMLPSTFADDEQQLLKAEKSALKRKKIASKLIKNIKERLNDPIQIQSLSNITTKESLFSVTIYKNEMSNIKDVIDINNLSRSNLVELAKFMRLWNPPLLPRFFILKRISNQLQFLRDDDKYIIKDGIDNFEGRLGRDICLSRALHPPPDDEIEYIKEYMFLSSDPEITNSMLIFYSICLINHVPKQILFKIPALEEKSDDDE